MKTKLKLRHVSLFVRDISASLDFYQGILGMEVYWAPNGKNVYLTNGDDVIALHQAEQLKAFTHPKSIGFDHLGFFAEDEHALHEWYAGMKEANLVVSPIEKHRDCSHGFYVYDADGNSIEILAMPKIANTVA